jgi:ADP-ribose pyrophosphatase
MNADDVEVTKKSTPFNGYFRVDRYRLRHKLFEGGWSGEIEREVFERGHAVTILLFDPEQDKLVFIEQFRPGAYAALASPWFDNGTSPWLIECVAGIIEPGEAPEGVARREAVEEADCAVSDIISVSHYLVSPGATSESMFVYCGRVNAPESGGIHGLREENENIRVVVVSPDEAFQWLDEGRVVNAMTVITLQWFRIHGDEVRARWGASKTPAGSP